jgi:cysteinyl-tRNA synthetase (EC 6.1.1.16)
VFTWENLDNAKIAYDKLIARIAALNPENGTVDEASMTALKEKFQKALDADLNTSLAITTLYDVLKADMNDATKLALLDNFDQVLGLTLLSHAEDKEKRGRKDNFRFHCIRLSDYRRGRSGD